MAETVSNPPLPDLVSLEEPVKDDAVREAKIATPPAYFKSTKSPKFRGRNASFRKASMEAVDPDVLLRDIAQRKSMAMQAGAGEDDVLPLAQDVLRDLVYLKMKFESQGDEKKRISSEIVLRVLNDTEMKDLLEKFLTKEFAEESFHFWVEVTKFKEQRADGGGVEAKAKEVFMEFVKQGSNQQINIPSIMVKEIKNAIDQGGEKVTLNIFDDALREVVAMLARDKLPRFLTDDSVKHRQDILISDEERNLNKKYSETQEKISEMALIRIKKEVVVSLKAALTFKVELDLVLKNFELIKHMQDDKKDKGFMKEEGKEKDADIVGMVDKVGGLMIDTNRVYAIYNQCTTIATMTTLFDALALDVQLNALVKELKVVMVGIFKGVADIIRSNEVQGTKKTLSALR